MKQGPCMKQLLTRPNASKSGAFLHQSSLLLPEAGNGRMSWSVPNSVLNQQSRTPIRGGLPTCGTWRCVVGRIALDVCIAWPWKCRHHDPPKRREPPAQGKSVTSQKSGTLYRATRLLAQGAVHTLVSAGTHVSELAAAPRRILAKTDSVLQHAVDLDGIQRSSERFLTSDRNRTPDSPNP
jgi:hypothetical protein